MTCDRCGSETTRPRLCRECALLESVENEAAHRDAPPLYECNQCGEERAESPDSTCWLCKSDRHEVGEDGRPEARTDGGQQLAAEPYRPQQGIFLDYGEGDGPYAAIIRFKSPEGPVYLVDRDGDDVHEFGFLMGHHPNTDEWCPDVDELPDNLVEDLEEHAGVSIDLGGGHSGE